MKLRHLLLPLLLSVAHPKASQAQFKAEGNHNNLDVKSGFVDLSLANTSGIEDYLNTRGEMTLKFRNNAVYGIRNGLLNHSFGGNLDVGLIGGYYNRTEQSTSDETGQTQDSPIGKITTKTTILKDNSSWDYGLGVRYRNFFIGYESATNRNKSDGSVLITIDQDNELTTFSSESDVRSRVYSAGFKHGFFKFIKNSNQNIDENGDKEKEESDTYLINGNYSIVRKDDKKAGIDIYYDKEGDISGFLNLNFFRDINFNFSHDSKEGGFTANLSSSDYSQFNHDDFERGLENRLRTMPRIYDSELETARRYLSDMFFTRPFSYSFSISLNENGELTPNLNLNLRNALFHYSDDSKRVGLKLGPAIGSYDFEQKELRAGVFLGRVH